MICDCCLDDERVEEGTLCCEAIKLCFQPAVRGRGRHSFGQGTRSPFDRKYHNTFESVALPAGVVER